MKNSTLIIEPNLSEKNYWRDLWKYRELFFVLAWRDVAVRYKQTFIGLAWAVIQPLATMIIFTIIFDKIAKLPATGSSPYALMVFAGLLPWQLFSSSLTGAANSLISNTNLISKVYFPRIIVPTSAIVVSLVDFIICFGILISLMLWYQIWPDWRLITLPLFILMGILASIGPGLLIAALNVKYRDFKYIVPFIVQFGLYVSPVGFSSSIIPDKWEMIYYLNPVAGVIDGFRWAILGNESIIKIEGLIISLTVIIIFLLVGIKQFRKMEKQFADII